MADEGIDRAIREGLQRRADMIDAILYSQPIADYPEWVTQPAPRGVRGIQLIRMRPNREPGPRMRLEVVFTTGQPVDAEGMAEMIETIKDMIQETFVASCDSLQLEQDRTPSQRRIDPNMRTPW